MDSDQTAPKKKLICPSSIIWAILLAIKSSSEHKRAGGVKSGGRGGG